MFAMNQHTHNFFKSVFSFLIMGLLTSFYIHAFDGDRRMPAASGQMPSYPQMNDSYYGMPSGNQGQMPSYSQANDSYYGMPTDNQGQMASYYQANDSYYGMPNGNQGQMPSYYQANDSYYGMPSGNQSQMPSYSQANDSYYGMPSGNQEQMPSYPQMNDSYYGMPSGNQEQMPSYYQANDSYYGMPSGNQSQMPSYYQANDSYYGMPSGNQSQMPSYHQANDSYYGMPNGNQGQMPSYYQANDSYYGMPSGNQSQMPSYSQANDSYYGMPSGNQSQMPSYPQMNEDSNGIPTLSNDRQMNQREESWRETGWPSLSNRDKKLRRPYDNVIGTFNKMPEGLPELPIKEENENEEITEASHHKETNKEISLSTNKPALKEKKSRSIAKHKRTQPAYRLRVGDKLLMSVYGDPVTRRPVLVDITGSISYLFISSMPAVGRTIDEIRHEIEERLKTFYKNPILIITATDVMPNFYTIIGEVRKPGKKVLEGNATLLSALAAGGGFTTRTFRNQTIDLVNLEHSFISRNGEVLPINFTKLVRGGDSRYDIPLKNGDYIYLATAILDKIYVLGEVGTTAAIEIIDPLSLAQALTFAGGVTLRASSRVAIIRGSLGCPDYYLVDINRILKGKTCDFMLEPGDVVYVPPRKFTLLRDIVKNGIRSFVSTIASLAGTKAFISITPAALGTDLFIPVPILNSGAGSSTFVVPQSTGGFSSGVIVPR